MAEANTEGRQLSARLHVFDRVTTETFLVDTGAEISLLPVRDDRNAKPGDLKLYAVNNTRIDTYGERFRTLHLGIRPITWIFCVAAVPYPIIGADLLKRYGLLVDLKGKSLIDPQVNSFTRGVIKQVATLSMSTIDSSTKFVEILQEFPGVVGIEQPPIIKWSDVFHHIVTTGPSVASRARRLSPDKLRAAKVEFKRLVELGICRPSNNPWASPIRLVMKKDGQWRVCGDYRGVNAVTVPDKFPIPHLHDCVAILRNKKIFSKLDLFKAYHQLPMTPEDIPKTAVITPFGLFEYKVITFGLSNAAQSFQRYIFRALGDLEFVFAYIDDVLIASASPEEHKAHLRVVLQRLKECNLRLNVEKC